jgi:hypothetical protein
MKQLDKIIVSPKEIYSIIGSQGHFTTNASMSTINISYCRKGKALDNDYFHIPSYYKYLETEQIGKIINPTDQSLRVFSKNGFIVFDHIVISSQEVEDQRLVREFILITKDYYVEIVISMWDIFLKSVIYEQTKYFKVRDNYLIWDYENDAESIFIDHLINHIDENYVSSKWYNETEKLIHDLAFS